MQIVSKFKDYYDHVAHIYGGGDPLHTYVREPISEDKQYQFIKLTDEDSSNLLYQISVFERLFLDTKLEIICCCGKSYIYSTKNGQTTLFKSENFSEDSDKVSRFYSGKRVLELIDSFQGKDIKFGLDLSKAIMSPVFLIKSFSFQKDRICSFVIQSNIPILKDYGIASLISPEAIYQDLSQFISSKIKDNPDTVKPNISSDKDKILQHGFDIKKSFRHRKN